MLQVAEHSWRLPHITLIDEYGAEHPSEFFAVVSEVFFEAPELLFDAYPVVYAQLRRFYRQDPLRPAVNVASQQT